MKSITIRRGDEKQLQNLPRDLEVLLYYASYYYSKPLPKKLPKTLKTLWLSGMRYTSLPELPLSLEKLECNVLTDLTSLPILPQSLKRLWLNSCVSLTCLPDLPKNLEELHCLYCNNLTSLPDLPELPNGCKLHFTY